MFGMKRLGVVVLLFLSDSCFGFEIESYYPPLEDQRFLLDASVSYFDSSLDILGYADKIGGRSKPESASIQSLVFSFQPASNLWFTYHYEDTSAEVIRSAEPFSLETTLVGHGLQVSAKLSNWLGFELWGTLGYAQRSQDELVIECYDYAGVVLGGSCNNTDFQLIDGDALLETGETITYPVFTTNAEEDRWLVQLQAFRDISDELRFRQSLTLLVSDISISYESRLFDIESSFILDANYGGRTLRSTLGSLRANLPQAKPWLSSSLKYGIGADYVIFDRWRASADLSYSYTTRVDYEVAAGVPDYRHNVKFSGSLQYAANEWLILYVQGDVFSNYLLGEDPLTYNASTARFFEHPYGQLSIGAVVTF